MGNFFGTFSGNSSGENEQNEQPKQQQNIEILTHLKTKNMKHVQFSINMISDHFPTNQTFECQEFADVFGVMLVEFAEPLFLVLENDHSYNGLVDLYEALATLIILCDDEYEDKLRALFKLFDFNENGVIDKQELVLTNQAAIRGLCKISNIPFPTLKQVEEYSLSIFTSVDKDKGGTISFDEYKSFINYNAELQEFLLKNVNVQTFESAYRRMNSFKTQYENIFNNLVSPNGDKVHINILESSLNTNYESLRHRDKSQLLEILSATSNTDCPSIEQGFIYKKSYLSVMKAWAAFDTTDINLSNKLGIQQIIFLIFAYEGDIPDQKRIAQEMKNFDTDKSGFVTREEWLSFICVNPENSLKMNFRTSLKDLFTEFDFNKNGSLSKDEIFELFKQQLGTYTSHFEAKGGNNLDTFNEMVISLAEEILHGMRKQFPEGNVPWANFKVFMERTISEMENLKKFFDSLIQGNQSQD